MNIIQKPTNKHGDDIEPLYLVLHDTAGNHPGDLNWLTNPEVRVSVQYLVAPDGTIYQMVPDTKRAWHAGDSEWGGLSGMNDYSIGIEISHIAGDRYPPAQLRALDELVWMLYQKHRFLGLRPLGHREIAPGRKSDPELRLGDYFWDDVQERVNPDKGGFMAGLSQKKQHEVYDMLVRLRASSQLDSWDDKVQEAKDRVLITLGKAAISQATMHDVRTAEQEYEAAVAERDKQKSEIIKQRDEKLSG